MTQTPAKPRSRKVLFWTSVVLFLVVVLPLAIILLPIHLGRQYWDQTQKELEDRGEKLFARDFIKPAIPDEENYFALPYFVQPEGGSDYDRIKAAAKTLKESGDFAKSEPTALNAPLAVSVSKDKARGASDPERREQGLKLLRNELLPLAAFREEMIQGSKRPLSNAQLRLQDGAAMKLESITRTMTLAQFFRLDSRLALAEGRTADAFEDFESLTRSAIAVAEEPSLFGSLIGYALWALAEYIVWDGIQTWSNEEMERIDHRLKQFPFTYGQLAFSLRSERAMINETVRSIVEKGGDLNQLDPNIGQWRAVLRHYLHVPWANFNRAMQSLIDLAEAGKPVPADVKRLGKLSVHQGIDQYTHFLERMTLPSIGDTFYKLARCHDENSLTRVAIALELWKRRHGAYPDTLSQLIPEYLEAIPAARLPGQSIQYRRDAPLSYCIWTFGWNETDEGGKREKMGAHDGDWSLATDAANP